MELRNLATFIRVADCNSFSKAAADLGYTQSTVTTQIKLLEEELGVRLFDRVGRTIRLTGEGELLLGHAREITARADAARQLLRQEGPGRGEVRLGVFESLCGVYLPELLRRFHDAYPKARLTIRTGPAEELAALLNANQLDVLWLYDRRADRPGWVTAFEREGRLVPICAPSSALAGAEAVPPGRLAGERLILTERGCGYRRELEEYLHGRGVAPPIFLEIGNMDIIKQFVAAGLGIGFLPDFILRPELEEGRLCALELEDFSPRMFHQVVHHRDKWLSPTIRAFLELVGERFAAGL